MRESVRYNACDSTGCHNEGTWTGGQRPVHISDRPRHGRILPAGCNWLAACPVRDTAPGRAVQVCYPAVNNYQALVAAQDEAVAAVERKTPAVFRELVEDGKLRLL